MRFVVNLCAPSHVKRKVCRERQAWPQLASYTFRFRDQEWARHFFLCTKQTILHPPTAPRRRSVLADRNNRRLVASLHRSSDVTNCRKSISHHINVPNRGGEKWASATHYNPQQRTILLERGTGLFRRGYFFTDTSYNI